MLRSACCALALCGAILASAAASAQEEAPAEPAAEAPATDAAAEPQGEFEKLLAQFRSYLEQIQQAQLNYKLAKPEERPAIEEQFKKLVAEGSGVHDQLVEAAIARYAGGDHDNQELNDLLLVVARESYADDNYELAYRVAKMLSDAGSPYKQTQLWTGMSAWAMGDYDEAAKYLKMAQESNVLDEGAQQVLPQLDKHREMWQKEQAIREQEASADDLPRVLFKTNKGDILIELYENEAPNTVANFIDLVDKKFYDGLTFHRVIHGFMAQGGDPKGEGSGGPGYTIPCECYQENRRDHFRGTLSMAHAGKDTGGSQFFLTFRPTMHLDGRHTAFGRVIEGFEVFPQMMDRDPSRNDPREPDKIISATVVRKRDHAYTPMKTPE